MPRDVVPIGIRSDRSSEIRSARRWNGKITCARLLIESCAARRRRRLVECVHLFHQRRRIDDHAVADDSLHARAQNAARNQLQNVFRVTDIDRVAGVVSALVARDDVEPVREKVHHLAFSLIAPLGAQYDQIAHVFWYTPRGQTSDARIFAESRMSLVPCACSGSRPRNRMIISKKHAVSDIFLTLGEPHSLQLIRAVSIGKLKTFQLYERVKLRFHLVEAEFSETLRKAAPRLWSRIAEHDDEFATDIAQVVLVSHLDMIRGRPDLLTIPHEDGFFSKDLDATDKLTEGWQQRVFDQFRTKYSGSLAGVLHQSPRLGAGETEQVFQPAARYGRLISHECSRTDYRTGGQCRVAAD